jgi:adenylate cyclase
LPLEIERKFLVREPPPDLATSRADEIEQGYLAVEGDAAEVRLRRRGDRMHLTVKRGVGRERTEVEVDLDDVQFDDLWPLTAGRRISKVRHSVPTEGGVIEVDIYSGDLSGLVVAEVEFDSDERAEEFDVPEWFGEEITGHPGYANKTLASRGLPDGHPGDARR